MNYKINTKFLLVYLLFAIAIFLTGSTVGHELFKYTIENSEVTKDVLLDNLMNSLYIVLLLVFLLSLGILLSIKTIIYRPLHDITMAAKEYSSGNLDHEITLLRGDEFGYLAATLNYMVSILRDNRDNQSQLLSNISHDFRSPLTSIKGYTNAILDGTIPTSEQNKYLEIVSGEADRLHILANDLLCLVELESKNISLSYSKVDLIEIIHYTANVLDSASSKKYIEFNLVIETKDLNINLCNILKDDILYNDDFSIPTLYCQCDKDKINRVFYNLIDNAIKFSPNNSVITIHISDLPDKFLIAVHDNGCGISEDQIGQIFQRFYKADHSRGINKTGCGLGLAITKEILLQHNQNISVESKVDSGTKFIFSLNKSI